MKPTLDDLIRSAKFCGYKPQKGNGGTVWVEGVYWNPPDNPAQDREILHALLAKGYRIAYDPVEGRPHQIWLPHSKHGEEISFDCHPNDFLTLAASRVQGQSDDT